MLRNNTDVMPGLHAAGEVTCVSEVQADIIKLKGRYADVALSDKGKRYYSDLLQAPRFIFDSRDQGAEERWEILNDREGVRRCRTTFECTEACPRGIEITRAIKEVKQAPLFGRV